MTPITGHRLRLSIPRRLVCDLLHASQHIPIVTFERRMQLAELAVARKRLANPPAWVLLIVKAFGIVATRHREFRQTYLPFPYPHLWEANDNIASVAVEREYHGELGVFFGFFKSPEKLSLTEMMVKLHDWKTKPVDEVREFRRAIKFARMPLLVRRALWKYATSWSGKIKGRNFGTFGISLTGASGATATNLIGPLTTALNTGVVQEDGSLDVRIHFDHRVLDGMPVSRALAELEDELRTSIVAELNAMAEMQTDTSALPVSRVSVASRA
jgi:hypothetical protein